MLWRYTINITETRADGNIYLVYEKQCYSLKKAYALACEAIKKMTATPTGVIIWKDFLGLSVPECVFDYGYTYFGYVDYYL